MSDIPIPQYIQNLTDDDLRKELAKNGEKIGPITPTTRAIYKKRLFRKLASTSRPVEDGARPTKPETPNNTQVETETKQAVIPKRDTVDRSTNTVKFQQENDSTNIIQQNSKVNTDRSKTMISSEPDKVFYGVHIPKCDEAHDFDDPIVFENKLTALSTLKKHKSARFKEFQTLKQAEEFSLCGNHVLEAKSSLSLMLSSKSENVINDYPQLKQQDLNNLVRRIESGDLSGMCELVWSNPKYLISSADGPVSLKPNARYNALHIAAKSNQSEICKEILTLLNNPHFQSLLFSNLDDEIVSNSRTEHIVDSYLNTPDKILFETPLHFASKAGFKDVVRELIAYDLCSLFSVNKFGQTASDIACSRASNDAKGCKDEIKQMLCPRYYVPLLRYHDNSERAMVGEPINSLKDLRKEGFCPLNSNLSVKAIAGPMPKEDAYEFRNIWATPSKQKRFGDKYKFLRRKDFEKGDEQIGRELASQRAIRWLEFWDFLDDFADFSTTEGMQKLEDHLKSNIQPSVDLEMEKLTDSFECMGLSCGKNSEEDCTPRTAHDLLGEMQSTPKRFERIRTNNVPMSGNTNNTSRMNCGFDNRQKKRFTSDSTDDMPVSEAAHRQGTSRNGRRDIAESQNTGSGDVTNQTGKDSKFENDSNLEKNLEFENFSKFKNDSKFDFAPKNLSEQMSVDNFHVLTDYRNATEVDSEIFSSMSVSTISDTCPGIQNAFITGTSPTKRDQDVMTAIGGTHVDPNKFPAINGWRNSVLSYAENERQKWSTPRKKGGRSLFPSCGNVDRETTMGLRRVLLDFSLKNKFERVDR